MSMKLLTFYFDAVSPEVRAVFDQLPQRLQGASVAVSYQPLYSLGAQTHPSMILMQQLALACAPAGGLPNRWTCERLLALALSGDVAAAQLALAPARDPQGHDVIQELRAATDAAVALGVGGGATLAVDGQLFVGEAGLAALSASWAAGSV
ncbi:MAG: hypothetical protein RLZZ618_2810 [Pseudomonadota bacterium]|jgi:2-hydroxychromene-2-carboxylate isomerase